MYYFNNLHAAVIPMFDRTSVKIWFQVWSYNYALHYLNLKYEIQQFLSSFAVRSDHESNSHTAYIEIRQRHFFPHYFIRIFFIIKRVTLKKKIYCKQSLFIIHMFTSKCLPIHARVNVGWMVLVPWVIHNTVVCFTAQSDNVWIGEVCHLTCSWYP